MIAPSPATRIFLAAGATDLRKSFDGLSELVRQRFGQDPLSGHLFVFTNRRKNRIKLLYWDGSGLWCCANMHDPKCAVIEIRKSPLPLPPVIRPGAGSSWQCWRETRCSLCNPP